MCVIAIVNKVRPSEEMINQMWNANDDGAGIAYPEGEGENREVVWEKGLSLAEAIEYCATAPLPYVVHFRVASVGGVCDELTHPFPISKETTNDKSGRTKGYVLFHNGDWRPWRDYVREAILKTGIPLPYGREWSDTRAMAFLCSIYGPAFMDFIEEKGVAFGPHDYEVFAGRSGWKKVNDIWCSNDFFIHRATGISSYSRMCKAQTCRRMDTDADGWCAEHRPPTTVKTQVQVQNPEVNPHGWGAGAGGGQHDAPFPQTDIQKACESLQVAEKLREEGKISKTLLKKLRKGLGKQILESYQKRQEREKRNQHPN